MGPVSSKLNPILQSHHPTLHDAEAKMAGSKFDNDEMHVLKATWQDLADRNNGKGIDKDTFLQYFPLNGLLGDRLFAQFNTKGTGYVDFDEFVTGLATVCRGTLDDKIHFIFNMYDVSKDKSVSKQELATLLNQVPKELLSQQPSYHNANIDNHGDSESVDNENAVAGSHEATSPLDSEFEEVDSYTNHDMVEKAFEECDLNHEGRLTYEEFKMWVQRNPLILQHIESILPYNGSKDMGRHSDKAESLPHMRRITSIARMSSSVINHSMSLHDVAGEVFNHGSAFRRSQSIQRVDSTRGRGNSLFSGSTSDSGLMTPPPLERGMSNQSAGVSHSNHGTNNPQSLDVLRKGSFGTESVMDTEEQARIYLLSALEVTQNETLKNSILKILDTFPEGRNNVGTHNAMLSLNGHQLDKEVYHTIVAMEAYLWKKGKSFLHMLSKRYYLLSGNCVYYYSHKNDIRPRGVIFLTGSIVERHKDEEMQVKGYYGFELCHQDLSTGEHHRHDRRLLYCKSEEEREKWVSALQHAAHVVPIEEEYVIGKELGRGRFSVVCECVHKMTGVHCAVKIIDKNTIEKDEKELLRTEIAVLKLVNHPNIIKMEGVYESKQYIYIVMEMLKGGELFERIVGRPRFTEMEAARLLRPLLESVAYLHDLGIVHRDLKPENILCGEELEDIKIADFGLSKMIMPKEKMDAACGTLSYVAPEVLTMQGYGKEADLWSVGVIMFLLLCGKLPFDGDDHNEIIKSTIQADLKVNPSVWNKLTDEAKSLMTSLLNKSPKDRITARDSLKHPFMILYPNTNPHNSHKRHVQFDRYGSRAMSTGSNVSSSNRPSMAIGIASNVLNSASASGKNTASAQSSPTNTPATSPPPPAASNVAMSTAPTAIVNPIVSPIPVAAAPSSASPDYDLGIASGINSKDDHDAVDSVNSSSYNSVSTMN